MPAKRGRAAYQRIGVCFADIRGFTRFADSAQANDKRLVDELLDMFFECIEQSLAAIDDRLNPRTALTTAVAEFASCKMTKALGDGAMIVWDMPNQGRRYPGTAELYAALELCILDFVQHLQCLFSEGLNELRRSHPGVAPLKELRLGIGVATGSAWKIKPAWGRPLDYAGRPVNVAARLQDKARPEGVVAELELAPEWLMERCCAAEGRICQVQVGGVSDKITVWQCVDRPVIRARQARTLGDLSSALKLLESMRGAGGVTPPLGTICVEDTETLFALRARWEKTFAEDLARLVADKRVDIFQLDLLDKTIDEMNKALRSYHTGTIRVFKAQGVLFHEHVARLSGPDNDEGLRRERFARDVHSQTSTVYSGLEPDLNQIVRDHTDIANAIRRGNTVAGEKMQSHLSGHLDRVTRFLLDDNKLDCP